ncbi:MAG: nitroreductase family protein [Deltaproteobacteria bacterium]|nr:nitroreductase family protein [Deltaproteobacteria bacterium]
MLLQRRREGTLRTSIPPGPETAWTPPFDLAVTDRLLTTTRAVRRRLDLSHPVEREVVLDCIRLSQQAPTGSNTQGWAWLLVDDPEKRRSLGELYRELAEANIPQARQSHTMDAQTARVYDSAEWLGRHLAEVPLLAIPCIREEFGGPSGNATAAAMYGSILPAAWSFQLALRSRGLGSAWTTLHLFREKEFAELLGIPAGILQVALLPVAYTKGTDFKAAKRRPPESITHWNHWQA